MKKIRNIIVALLALLIALVGCVAKEKEQEKIDENENNKVEVVENLNDEKEIFYTYYDRVVGSRKNGQWYSVLGAELNTNVWKYSDLLSKGKYYSYDSLGNKNEINSLTVFLDYGVGSLFGEGLKSENVDIEKMMNDMKMSAIQLENGYYKLNLPVQNDCLELSTNFCNADIKFDNPYVIATNADYDLKFAKQEVIEEIPENINQYVLQKLKDNNMPEKMKYDCSAVYEADIDNDGTLDKVYWIKSEDSEQIEKDGQASFVIAEIGEKVINIFESCSYNFYDKFARKVDIVDIDNDNEYECLLVIYANEGNNVNAYDYVDGNFKLVMSNYNGI